MMPIRLVLADDSDVMRPAIARVLKEDLRIELVGEATSFAETLELIAALKPDVLLLDLHMRDELKYSPELVKSQAILSTKCILAISLYQDDEAAALAESFGAKMLLDKARLYSELIPAIMQFCPSVTLPKTAKPVGKNFKELATPSITSADAS